MRTTTANLKTLMGRDDVEKFIILQIGPNTTAQYLRFTTAPYNHSYAGNTYVADHGLSDLEAPEVSSVLDKTSLSLTFIDNNYSLRPFFDTSSETPAIGLPVEIYGGFINDTGGTLFGVPNGGIFPDYIHVYSGTIDGYSYNLNEAQITLEIRVSSPMGAFELTLPNILSKEALQSKYPTDTSFDQIYHGSKTITLLWGKE